jgi:hypothetical protein
VATETVRLRGAVDRVTHDQGGRFYVWQGKKYWSVTTILQAVPKMWMGPWVKKLTATYAVENIDLLSMMLARHSPAEVIEWVKKASDRKRDAGANLGSTVHEAAEAYVLGQPYPELTPAQVPYMDAFKGWLDEWQPSFLAIEAPVFSERHWFAGTLDAIVEVQGVRLLIDYKTTASGVHAENALQLAAYRHSETYIGLPDGDEEATPWVDGAAVVLIRPEGVRFVPVRTDRAIFDMFLYVRETFRWTEETQRTVLGKAAQANFPTCARRECGHHGLLHPRFGCSASVRVREVQPSDHVIQVAGRGAGGLVRCRCAGFRATPLKKERAS